MDPATREALQRGFPDVRWDLVEFHEGIPALLRWKGARAMVLPCAWHPRRVHVHVAQGHEDILPKILRHEGVHVQQYQALGAGVGYLRPFVIAYLGWVPFRGTGRRHPMEAPAYGSQGNTTSGFWRIVLGEGRARWLAPVRLALGTAGALVALVLGPLVEVSRPAGRPPP
jgi:hypothetical protein